MERQNLMRTKIVRFFLVLQVSMVCICAKDIILGNTRATPAAVYTNRPPGSVQYYLSCFPQIDDVFYFVSDYFYMIRNVLFYVSTLVVMLVSIKAGFALFVYVCGAIDGIGVLHRTIRRVYEFLYPDHAALNQAVDSLKKFTEQPRSKVDRDDVTTPSVHITKFDTYSDLCDYCHIYSHNYLDCIHLFADTNGCAVKDLRTVTAMTSLEVLAQSYRFGVFVKRGVLSYVKKMIASSKSGKDVPIYYPENDSPDDRIRVERNTVLSSLNAIGFSKVLKPKNKKFKLVVIRDDGIYLACYDDKYDLTNSMELTNIIRYRSRQGVCQFNVEGLSDEVKDMLAPYRVALNNGMYRVTSKISLYLPKIVNSGIDMSALKNGMNTAKLAIRSTSYYIENLVGSKAVYAPKHGVLFHVSVDAKRNFIESAFVYDFAYINLTITIPTPPAAVQQNPGQGIPITPPRYNIPNNDYIICTQADLDAGYIGTPKFVLISEMQFGVPVAALDEVLPYEFNVDYSDTSSTFFCASTCQTEGVTSFIVGENYAFETVIGEENTYKVAYIKGLANITALCGAFVHIAIHLPSNLNLMYHIISESIFNYSNITFVYAKPFYPASIIGHILRQKLVVPKNYKRFTIANPSRQNTPKNRDHYLTKKDKKVACFGGGMSLNECRVVLTIFVVLACFTVTSANVDVINQRISNDYETTSVGDSYNGRVLYVKDNVSIEEFKANLTTYGLIEYSCGMIYDITLPYFTMSYCSDIPKNMMLYIVYPVTFSVNSARMECNAKIDTGICNAYIVVNEYSKLSKLQKDLLHAKHNVQSIIKKYSYLQCSRVSFVQCMGTSMALSSEYSLKTKMHDDIALYEKYNGDILDIQIKIEQLEGSDHALLSDEFWQRWDSNNLLNSAKFVKNILGSEVHSSVITILESLVISDKVISYVAVLLNVSQLREFDSLMKICYKKPHNAFVYGYAFKTDSYVFVDQKYILENNYTFYYSYLNAMKSYIKTPELNVPTNLRYHTNVPSGVVFYISETDDIVTEKKFDLIRDFNFELNKNDTDMLPGFRLSKERTTLVRQGNHVFTPIYHDILETYVHRNICYVPVDNDLNEGFDYYVPYILGDEDIHVDRELCGSLILFNGVVHPKCSYTVLTNDVNFCPPHAAISYVKRKSFWYARHEIVQQKGYLTSISLSDYFNKEKRYEFEYQRVAAYMEYFDISIEFDDKVRVYSTACSNGVSREISCAYVGSVFDHLDYFFTSLNISVKVLTLPAFSQLEDLDNSTRGGKVYIVMTPMLTTYTKIDKSLKSMCDVTGCIYMGQASVIRPQETNILYYLPQPWLYTHISTPFNLFTASKNLANYITLEWFMVLTSKVFVHVKNKNMETCVFNQLKVLARIMPNLIAVSYCRFTEGGSYMININICDKHTEEHPLFYIEDADIIGCTRRIDIVIDDSFFDNYFDNAGIDFNVNEKEEIKTRTIVALGEPTAQTSVIANEVFRNRVTQLPKHLFTSVPDYSGYNKLEFEMKGFTTDQQVECDYTTLKKRLYYGSPEECRFGTPYGSALELLYNSNTNLDAVNRAMLELKLCYIVLFVDDASPKRYIDVVYDVCVVDTGISHPPPVRIKHITLYNFLEKFNDNGKIFEHSGDKFFKDSVFEPPMIVDKTTKVQVFDNAKVFEKHADYIASIKYNFDTPSGLKGDGITIIVDNYKNGLVVQTTPQHKSCVRDYVQYFIYMHTFGSIYDEVPSSCGAGVVCVTDKYVPSTLERLTVDYCPLYWGGPSSLVVEHNDLTKSMGKIDDVLFQVEYNVFNAECWLYKGDYISLISLYTTFSMTTLPKLIGCSKTLNRFTISGVIKYGKYIFNTGGDGTAICMCGDHYTPVIVSITERSWESQLFDIRLNEFKSLVDGNIDHVSEDLCLNTTIFPNTANRNFEGNCIKSDSVFYVTFNTDGVQKRVSFPMIPDSRDKLAAFAGGFGTIIKNDAYSGYIFRKSYVSFGSGAIYTKLDCGINGDSKICKGKIYVGGKYVSFKTWTFEGKVDVECQNVKIGETDIPADLCSNGGVYCSDDVELAHNVMSSLGYNPCTTIAGCKHVILAHGQSKCDVILRMHKSTQQYPFFIVGGMMDYALQNKLDPNKFCGYVMKDEEGVATTHHVSDIQPLNTYELGAKYGTETIWSTSHFKFKDRGRFIYDVYKIVDKDLGKNYTCYVLDAHNNDDSFTFEHVEQVFGPDFVLMRYPTRTKNCYIVKGFTTKVDPAFFRTREFAQRVCILILTMVLLGVYLTNVLVQRCNITIESSMLVVHIGVTLMSFLFWRKGFPYMNALFSLFGGVYLDLGYMSWVYGLSVITFNVLNLPYGIVDFMWRIFELSCALFVKCTYKYFIFKFREVDVWNVSHKVSKPEILSYFTNEIKGREFSKVKSDAHIAREKFTIDRSDTNASALNKATYEMDLYNAYMINDEFEHKVVQSRTFNAYVDNFLQKFRSTNSIVIYDLARLPKKSVMEHTAVIKFGGSEVRALRTGNLIKIPRHVFGPKFMDMFSRINVDDIDARTIEGKRIEITAMVTTSDADKSWIFETAERVSEVKQHKMSETIHVGYYDDKRKCIRTGWINTTGSHTCPTFDGSCGAPLFAYVDGELEAVGSTVLLKEVGGNNPNCSTKAFFYDESLNTKDYDLGADATHIISKKPLYDLVIAGTLNCFYRAIMVGKPKIKAYSPDEYFTSHNILHQSFAFSDTTLTSLVDNIAEKFKSAGLQCVTKPFIRRVSVHVLQEIERNVNYDAKSEYHALHDLCCAGVFPINWDKTLLAFHDLPQIINYVERCNKIIQSNKVDNCEIEITSVVPNIFQYILSEGFKHFMFKRVLVVCYIVFVDRFALIRFTIPWYMYSILFFLREDVVLMFGYIMCALAKNNALLIVNGIYFKIIYGESYINPVTLASCATIILAPYTIAFPENVQHLVLPALFIIDHVRTISKLLRGLVDTKISMQSLTLDKPGSFDVAFKIMINAAAQLGFISSTDPILTKSTFGMDEIDDYVVRIGDKLRDANPNFETDYIKHLLDVGNGMPYSFGEDYVDTLQDNNVSVLIDHYATFSGWAKLTKLPDFATRRNALISYFDVLLSNGCKVANNRLILLRLLTIDNDNDTCSTYCNEIKNALKSDIALPSLLKTLRRMDLCAYEDFITSRLPYIFAAARAGNIDQTMLHTILADGIPGDISLQDLTINDDEGELISALSDSTRALSELGCIIEDGQDKSAVSGAYALMVMSLKGGRENSKPSKEENKKISLLSHAYKRYKTSINQLETFYAQKNAALKKLAISDQRRTEVSCADRTAAKHRDIKAKTLTKLVTLYTLFKNCDNLNFIDASGQENLRKLMDMFNCVKTAKIKTNIYNNDSLIVLNGITASVNGDFKVSLKRDDDNRAMAVVTEQTYPINVNIPPGYYVMSVDDQIDVEVMFNKIINNDYVVVQLISPELFVETNVCQGHITNRIRAPCGEVLVCGNKKHTHHSLTCYGLLLKEFYAHTPNCKICTDKATPHSTRYHPNCTGTFPRLTGFNVYYNSIANCDVCNVCSICNGDCTCVPVEDHVKIQSFKVTKNVGCRTDLTVENGIVYKDYKVVGYKSPTRLEVHEGTVPFRSYKLYNKYDGETAFISKDIVDIGWTAHVLRLLTDTVIRSTQSDEVVNCKICGKMDYHGLLYSTCDHVVEIGGRSYNNKNARVSIGLIECKSYNKFSTKNCNASYISYDDALGSVPDDKEHAYISTRWCPLYGSKKSTHTEGCTLCSKEGWHRVSKEIDVSKRILYLMFKGYAVGKNKCNTCKGYSSGAICYFCTDITDIVEREKERKRFIKNLPINSNEIVQVKESTLFSFKTRQKVEYSNGRYIVNKCPGGDVRFLVNIINGDQVYTVRVYNNNDLNVDLLQFLSSNIEVTGNMALFVSIINNDDIVYSDDEVSSQYDAIKSNQKYSDLFILNE